VFSSATLRRDFGTPFVELPLFRPDRDLPVVIETSFRDRSADQGFAASNAKTRYAHAITCCDEIMNAELHLFSWELDDLDRSRRLEEQAWRAMRQR
jgi:hypothetical protein